MTPEKMYNQILDHYMKNFTRLSKMLNEDIVQEAYTRALAYHSSYHPDKNFNKWFSTILRNCRFDYAKEERAHGAVDEVHEAEAPRHRPEIMDDVERIIAKEPEDHQYILHLSYIQQYPQKDIAKVVDKSEKAIEHIILKFRKGLKRKLKEGK